MNTTQNLRQIMTTAWQFFRTTGQSFSDCLKKACANFKLAAAMRIGIVRFYFQKVDGTVREAWGTLRSDLIPQHKGDDRKRNDTVQAYFDTEKQEYRCFKKLNLITL
ncbi:MAG: SH3 beta-barrel fold-containing protein [Prevotellaceae bacterium]|jgi:hypothetical protein|nr:SH3 beta-barrel fold-containing protein [Prevotellaceae bacterium]